MKITRRQLRQIIREQLWHDPEYEERISRTCEGAIMTGKTSGQSYCIWADEHTSEEQASLEREHAETLVRIIGLMMRHLVRVTGSKEVMQETGGTLIFDATGGTAVVKLTTGGYWPDLDSPSFHREVIEAIQRQGIPMRGKKLQWKLWPDQTWRPTPASASKPMNSEES